MCNWLVSAHFPMVGETNGGPESGSDITNHGRGERAQAMP